MGLKTSSYWVKTWSELSTQQQEEVNKGLLCPGCLNKYYIQLVLVNRNSNTYKCAFCPAKWEGYK